MNQDITTELATTGRAGKILVIDDESSICEELTILINSFGYNAYSITSVNQLNEGLSFLPDMVLLDIWMPGKDGLDLLQEILTIRPKLPVIMMSGHATIATAVKATQLGAVDFLEKPLDLEQLESKIKNILQNKTSNKFQEDRKFFGHSEIGENNKYLSEKQEASTARILPRKDIFGEQPWSGRAIKQKTLKNSTILYGQGLHTGRKSGVSLEPLPANSGIHFVGVSNELAVPAHVDAVESTGYATSLKRGSTFVQTIEHLMSALHAYGICNLLIKCNEEVPVLDGSALEFCRTIEEVGVLEQSETIQALKVQKEVTIGNDNEFIKISPAESFIIEYELSYPEPLGIQQFKFEMDSPDSYKELIAPARTFGFVHDVGYLQSKGLALGGRFDNFVLYGKDGAINQELRFANEAVRHKILDAIGDLYLLGRPLHGHIRAKMTGHSDNISLLKAIQDSINYTTN